MKQMQEGKSNKQIYLDQPRKMKEQQKLGQGTERLNNKNMPLHGHPKNLD